MDRYSFYSRVSPVYGHKHLKFLVSKIKCNSVLGIVCFTFLASPAYVINSEMVDCFPQHFPRWIFAEV